MTRSIQVVTPLLEVYVHAWYLIARHILKERLKTGGRDTAGMGGRGGYKRLFKGGEIKQVNVNLLIWRPVEAQTLSGVRRAEEQCA